MLYTKFQGYLPHMDIVAILANRLEPFEQTFIPPVSGGYIWNLVPIGLLASEEMFENVDRRRMMTNARLYYKLYFEPSTQLT